MSPISLKLRALLIRGRTGSAFSLLRRLGQRARLSQNLLKFRAIRRAYRSKRQPINFLDHSSHGQRGLDRDGIAFDEESFEDGRELAVQFARLVETPFD